MLNNKTLLLTVAFALLIPFGAHAQNDIGGSAANPDDNQEFQNAHMATDPIVIDGRLDEWNVPAIVDPLIGIPKIGRDNRVAGDPPSQFVVHEELGGTWTGPADQSSSLQVAWTADGLYLGLIVTDDYHENAANSPWNGDSLQMMVTTEERSQDDFALYNYALGGIEDDHAGFEEDPPLAPEEYFISHERGLIDFFSDLDYLLYNEATDEPNVAIHRDTVELRTTYEIFLGTEALGLEVEEMKEGTQIGLAMVINDGDEDAPGQKGWVGLGAHSIVFGKTAGEAALFTFVGPHVDEPEPEFLAADFNEDGIVNFADFLILSNQFNQTVDPAGTDPDINSDGTVNFADFLVLSTQFNMTSGGAVQVPEPSSLGLLGLGVLFLGFLRRRNG